MQLGRCKCTGFYPRKHYFTPTPNQCLPSVQTQSTLFPNRRNCERDCQRLNETFIAKTHIAPVSLFHLRNSKKNIMTGGS